MSKYDLRYSQIGAVGDGAQVNNVTFYGKKEKEEVVNMESLLVEIETLKRKLDLKEDKSTEEYRILADVAEIQKYAKGKDIDKVIEKIRNCATTVLYDMTLGISGGILANLISKVLNI